MHKSRKTEGVSLAYRVIKSSSSSSSSSNEALVCICGLSSTKEDWSERFLNSLCRYDLDVIILDNRGIGESSSPSASSFTLYDLANDVLELTNHLNYEELHVFGASMGGMIAQLVPLISPHRVKTLIIGCSMHGGANARTTDTLLNAMNPQYLRKHGVRKFTERLIELNLTDEFARNNTNIVNELVDVSLNTKRPSSIIMKQVMAIQKFNTEEILQHIQCPVLIIHGDSDRVLPLQNSFLMQQKLSNGAQLRVLPKCGHLFWIQHTETSAMYIREFIMKHSSSTTTTTTTTTSSRRSGISSSL